MDTRRIPYGKTKDGFADCHLGRSASHVFGRLDGVIDIGGYMSKEKVNYGAGKKGLDKMFVKPGEKLRKTNNGGKGGGKNT